MRISKLLSLLCVLELVALGDETIRFTAKGRKPLTEIISQLEDSFHWRVSYEEAPVLWREELGSGIAPTKVLHAFVRSVPMAVDIPAVTAASPEARERVIKLVLDAYHKSGNRGEFRAIQTADFIHIVPTKVRGVNGELQEFQPMFDTPVSIPAGKYNLLGLLSKVISQVGQERGLRIEMGTYPLNLFMQTSLTEQANKEPAREVLVRVFDEINAPLLAGGLPSVRLTWSLRYNSNDEFYFLNIYPIPPADGDGLGTPAGMERSQTQGKGK